MDIFIPENLKIAATVFNLLASVILAFRVKNILSALAFVADMHENNINQLASSHQNIVLGTGSNEHVKRAKGTTLLILGFSFYGIAAILNFLALTIWK